MGTRDVLRKAKPKIYPCEISAGTVHVRALSGAGRSAYLALVRKHENDQVPSADIAALGLCDEDGTLVYEAEKEKDMQELSETDGDDLKKICMKIFEVSGLSGSAVEDAEKKS